MDSQSTKKERIDIRVTPEEKKMFNEAREQSGDSSLSGFITRIIKNKSLAILREKQRILASERDKKIFFDAIFRDHEPNKALKDAAKNYNKTSQE